MDQTAAPIHVIATDEQGTRSALAEASRLARTSPSQVVILVPQFVSFARPPASPLEAAALTDRYRDLAEAAGVDALVRVCVCNRFDDLFRWMLAKRSQIVVGGRHRWLWPTAEERLARRLKHEGHHVVFAAA